MNDRWLFRGKRVSDGEWVFGNYAHDGEGNTVIETMNSFDMFEEMHRVASATVGQCTGFRDKNGRLIFEGDIVRLYTTKKGVSSAVVIGDFSVGWDDRFSGHNYFTAKGALSYSINTYKQPDREIIGTIHDKAEDGGNIE